MSKPSLCLLLLISIVLQSIIVVSYSEDHQISSEHLKIEHNHDTDPQKYFQAELEALETDHDSADCHHCGHCQGSHTQWNAESCFISVVSFSGVNEHFYNHLFDTSFNRVLLRPPIS